MCYFGDFYFYSIRMMRVPKRYTRIKQTLFDKYQKQRQNPYLTPTVSALVLTSALLIFPKY